MQLAAKGHGLVAGSTDTGGYAINSKEILTPPSSAGSGSTLRAHDPSHTEDIYAPNGLVNVWSAADSGPERLRAQNSTIFSLTHGAAGVMNFGDWFTQRPCCRTAGPDGGRFGSHKQPLSARRLFDRRFDALEFGSAQCMRPERCTRHLCLTMEMFGYWRFFEGNALSSARSMSMPPFANMGKTFHLNTNCFATPQTMLANGSVVVVGEERNTLGF